MHILPAIRTFAFEHDDAPAFHATYLVMTVIAAAMFNVGVFGLLVAAHMCLDVSKYRRMKGVTTAGVITRTFRESVVDVFLLALALCFAVYFHHGAGIVAVSGLLRVEEALVRAIGMLIPRMEVLWHGTSAFFNYRKHMREMHATAGPWTLGEKLCVGGLAVACMLLLVAPRILPASVDVAHVLTEEMVPWRL